MRVKLQTFFCYGLILFGIEAYMMVGNKYLHGRNSETRHWIVFDRMQLQIEHLQATGVLLLLARVNAFVTALWARAILELKQADL
jgi:hypothetical protein